METIGKDTDSDEMECEDAESMEELEEQDAEEEEAGGGTPFGAIFIKDSLFCFIIQVPI